MARRRPEPHGPPPPCGRQKGFSLDRAASAFAPALGGSLTTLVQRFRGSTVMVSQIALRAGTLNMEGVCRLRHTEAVFLHPSLSRPSPTTSAGSGLSCFPNSGPT